MLPPAFRHDFRITGLLVVLLLGGWGQSLPAPQISNVTANAFTLTWSTNDALNTQVWYGVGSASQDLANWTLTTAHSATVTGLQPATTYAVQIESSYFTNPDLTSPVFGVTTLPATSGGGGGSTGGLDTPVVSGITASGFTLSWTTGQPLNTQVHYGVGQPSQTAANWSLVTDHMLVLSGLATGTTYSVQAESSYFSNPDLLGPVVSVTTSGSTAAAMTTPTVSNLTPTSLTVSWATSQNLNTQLWYGIGAATRLQANWTLTSSHSMQLTGLQPATTYALQAESSFFSNPDLKSGLLTATTPAQKPAGSLLKTIFLIVLENEDWKHIAGNPQAPYINNTLLPMSSYAVNDQAVPNLHPSEPNYLWLEAGTNFGITDDGLPAVNHQHTTQHLVSLMDQAGKSWKAYVENISGTTCPFTDTSTYTPVINAPLFFDDVTGGLNPGDPYCIQHERPFSELAGDLRSGAVANYNLLIPNLCDDMHSCGIGSGDAWLAQVIPQIMNSAAYQNGGVIFITWDENEDDASPIGLIVLSPFARGNGYSNSFPYTHSSLLRTMQEILGVTPLLGDAANATDLSGLFQQFP